MSLSVTQSTDLSDHLSELSKARTTSIEGVHKVLHIARNLNCVPRRSPAHFPVSDIYANMVEHSFGRPLLLGVRIEYQQRHNFFIDCLAEEVHLHAVPAVAGVWEGRTVYQASSNLKKGTAGVEKYSARNHAMFSFIPPGAGMYLWMKFHLNQLDPSFASGDEDTLDTKLWIKLPENGVLFRPGWMFTRTANAMIKNSHSTDSGHFCVCFINIDVRVLISMHLRATWFPDLEKISHYLRVRMTHPRVLSTEGLVLDTGQLFGVSNDHHVDRNVTVYQETLT